MKNRMSRKLLSLLAVFALLVSLTTTISFAADTALTRGELAVQLIQGAGLSGKVTAYQARTSSFTDVAEDSQYEGYINLAYATGLMGGREDGCFYPEAPATQVEAATAVMQYVGLPLSLLKSWPADYSKAANAAGLTAGITYDAGMGITAAEFQTMMKNGIAIVDKPVIGISWKSNKQNYKSFWKIMEQAGGVAFELPQITSYAMGNVVVGAVDGVVVTGGEDGNPDLYGDPHSPLLEDNNALRDLRDTSDYNLVRAAVEKDVPMLDICRGMQMLNVVMGGGLIQDLPTYLGTTTAAYVTHRMPAGTPNRDYTPHNVTLLDGSKWVETIVGSKAPKNVASWHHQIVDPKRVGTGLTIAGYGPDNVIEVLEYRDNEFTLGVQFHPERDALGNEPLGDAGDVAIAMNYFKTLVHYAGN